MRISLASVLVFAVVLAVPRPVAAQTASTGALTGTVTDAAAAVAPGVRVTVTSDATGETRTTVSSDKGSYLVPLLSPGTYRVELAKAGFKAAIKTGLQISVTETARLDIQLEAGEIEERVTVVADARMLQTESSALGRVTTRELVSSLPLVTRNYTQIVTLSPGVAAGVTNATELGRGSGGEGGGNFRSHGAFGRDNNFQMNGVPVNDLQTSAGFSAGLPVPNPDAIQEFKVQTGQYDASYGRNAGANVNVVTRSGTNELHGSAFEFLRDDALNANSFFRNKVGEEKGLLKQHQFGGTAGGPIKRDRMVFFASYQGMRQRNGVGGGGTSSFFSPPFGDDRSRAALGRLFGGRSGALGGVAVAPDGSNISPQALALLNLRLPSGALAIPTPQTIDASQPFDRQGFSIVSDPATFDEDQVVASLDFLHTPASTFEGRLFAANSDQRVSLPGSGLGDPSVPGFPSLGVQRFRNVSVRHAAVIGSSLFNQMEFGFNRLVGRSTQDEPFRYADVGVTAPPTADPFPQIDVLGSMALGGRGQGVSTKQTDFTLQDSLTYVRGRQTWRLGGGMTHTRIDFSDFHFFGGALFLSWPDFLLGLPGGSVASGGNGTPFSNVFLSFDLPGLFDREWSTLDGHAFVQNDLKLTSTLTLNLGVRYERLAHFSDALGRNGGFDITRANPNPPAAGSLDGFLVPSNFQGTIPPGVTQLDNTLGIRGDHQHNVGPRVGVAWRLPERITPAMVLRGGYGIYYTRATGSPFTQLISSPPFASTRMRQGVENATASFANPFQPALALPQFTPYAPATQLTAQIIDQGYRPPMTQQYSVNLQTELARDLLLEVGYVGARGSHQILAHSLNQARLASPSDPIRGETTNTVANIGRRVPILGFLPLGLIDTASAFESRYDGLEVSLTKRLSRGLQFLTAYTFSKALSEAATNTGAGGSSISGNQADPSANYGRNDFNRAHRLVVSFVYRVPGPQRFPAAIDGLLQGWSIAGVTTFQSGLPLTLFGTNSNNAFGISRDRAQLAPGCTHADLSTSGKVHDRLDGYFNAACIARDADGDPVWPVIGDDGRATAFGNSGVGIVSGPDQRNVDLAIVKRTSLARIRNGASLDLRIELFNAFNTPQFSAPDTDVTSSTFGVIRGTAVNPRIVQLAVKVAF